jgi:hypothetical protein
VSEFIGRKLAPIPVRQLGPAQPGRDAQPGPEPGAWRKVLSAAQVAQVADVAGPELLRTGYGG